MAPDGHLPNEAVIVFSALVPTSEASTSFASVARYESRGDKGRSRELFVVGPNVQFGRIRPEFAYGQPRLSENIRRYTFTIPVAENSTLDRTLATIHTAAVAFARKSARSGVLRGTVCGKAIARADSAAKVVIPPKLGSGLIVPFPLGHNKLFDGGGQAVTPQSCVDTGIITSTFYFKLLFSGYRANHGLPVAILSVELHRATFTADEEFVRPIKKDAHVEATVCAVCLDSQRRVVFLPCKHLCACVACASKLKICPICRAPKDNSLVIFVS